MKRPARTTFVPFLVKLAGQHRQTPYAKPFHRIVTKQIITEVLRAHIRTPEDIAMLRSISEHPAATSDTPTP